MTEPTQAQVEAAAQVMGELVPTYMLREETRLSIAAAMLTAAAAVTPEKDDR
jgi:hypothetical protein